MAKTDSISNPVERAEQRLKWAERELSDARKNLLTAQEWLKNAEQIHADRQRELAEIVKANLATLPAPTTKGD